MFQLQCYNNRRHQSQSTCGYGVVRFDRGEKRKNVENENGQKTELNIATEFSSEYDKKKKIMIKKYVSSRRDVSTRLRGDDVFDL